LYRPTGGRVGVPSGDNLAHVNGDNLTLAVVGTRRSTRHRTTRIPGYLVSHGDVRIWVDAGSGTLGPLQHHVRLAELNAIWIAYLHADHNADPLTVDYGLLYTDIRLDAPIPLFGPPGIADRLAHFLTNADTRSPVESAFAVDELYDGH